MASAIVRFPQVRPGAASDAVRHRPVQTGHVGSGLDDMHRLAGRWRAGLVRGGRVCGEDLLSSVASRLMRSNSRAGTWGCPRELEEVPMSIVGGLDIHRKQLTFDYLDTATGQVVRGQVSPADREHLRAWLARFAGRGDAAFAAEGCTGWRYVAGELAAAGIAVHLAEPADTAAARGRKRRAKTDRTDARHLRQLLAEGRLPECWIPPPRILECRALLELYHDLRREHTAWLQRIHAVFFHQGRPGPGRARADHRAGPGRGAGGRSRAPVAGRAGPGRHRPGDDDGAGGPAARAAAPAAGRRRAHGRREGPG